MSQPSALWAASSSVCPQCNSCFFTHFSSTGKSTVANKTVRRINKTHFISDRIRHQSRKGRRSTNYLYCPFFCPPKHCEQCSSTVHNAWDDNKNDTGMLLVSEQRFQNVLVLHKRVWPAPTTMLLELKSSTIMYSRKRECQDMKQWDDVLNGSPFVCQKQGCSASYIQFFAC